MGYSISGFSSSQLLSVVPVNLARNELQQAIAKVDLKTIQKLQLTSEFLNQPLPNGELPLVYALKQRNETLIQILIAGGADPGKKDDQGLSAVDYALLAEDYHAAVFLLEPYLKEEMEKQESLLKDEILKGAAKEMIGKILNKSYINCENGNNDMHVAIANNHLENIDFCLKNQRDLINLPNHDGCTPLHLAAAKGDFPLMMKLIQNGADLSKTIESDSRLTPLALLRISVEKNNPLNISKLDILIFLATVTMIVSPLISIHNMDWKPFLVLYALSSYVGVAAQFLRLLGSIKSNTGRLGALAGQALVSLYASQNGMVNFGYRAWQVSQLSTSAFQGLHSCWRNNYLGKDRALLKAVITHLPTVYAALDWTKKLAGDYSIIATPLFEDEGNRLFFEKLGVCVNLELETEPRIFREPSKFFHCVEEAQNLSEKCDVGEKYAEYDVDTCLSAKKQFMHYQNRIELLNNRWSACQDLYEKDYDYISNDFASYSACQNKKYSYISACEIDFFSKSCIKEEGEFQSLIDHIKSKYYEKMNGQKFKNEDQKTYYQKAHNKNENKFQGQKSSTENQNTKQQSKQSEQKTKSQEGPKTDYQYQNQNTENQQKTKDQGSKKQEKTNSQNDNQYQKTSGQGQKNYGQQNNQKSSGQYQDQKTGGQGQKTYGQQNNKEQNSNENGWTDFDFSSWLNYINDWLSSIWNWQTWSSKSENSNFEQEMPKTEMPKKGPLDDCLFSANKEISCINHAKTILGMNSFFTCKDITKNFRVLARKHHPDKAKTEDKANAQYNFQRIQAAFDLLKTQNFCN